MTDFPELNRLKDAADAELAQLKAAFKASIDRLRAELRHDPERLHAEMAAIGKDFHDRVNAAIARLHGAVGIDPSSPPPPFRPRFEEPRRRRPPSVRRGLPKWPPRPRRPSAGGVTVEPNKPNNLSGGAAAPLEFD